MFQWKIFLKTLVFNLSGRVSYCQDMEEVQQEQGEQGRLANREDSDLSDHTPIKNWKYFILFSYLYLLQGIVSGIASTMPFVYPILPNYATMALFNANQLPFSFQLRLAPFVQKFTSISYGKRKFWIVISTSLTGLIIIFSSFYTNQRYSNLMAIMFILAQISMAILDIAAHAIMLKELKSKSHTSIIMGYSQIAGALIGALIILKLTNLTFAKSIGLTHPITSPQVVLLAFGILIIIPAILLHFKFNQTILQSQRRGSRFSFGEIICYYKVCIRCSSRYFRTCIFQLFYIQGLNFFTALYSYELVKAGFSRNTLNTLGTLLVIPIVILNFFYGTWTNYLKGRRNSLIAVLLLHSLVHLYLVVVFPLQVWIIAVTSFLTSVLSSWRFYLASYMINDFQVHALTGMFITFMASFANLGMQTSLQTWLSGKFGWKLCALIGTGLEILIVIFLPKWYSWIQQGDSDVPQQIRQEPQQEPPKQSNQLELPIQK